MADKKLPFFRWFPADAQTDELYGGFSLEELGLFHRMLNLSWINNGLPADERRLAILLGLNFEAFVRMWKNVRQAWFMADDRLYNGRQEQERRFASDASSRRAEAGRLGGNAKAMLKQSMSNGITRASVSVSVSEETSKTEKTSTRARAADLNGLASERFEEFWGKYPRKVRKDYACSNFMSYVTVDTEAAMFACLDRYLSSAEVSRGVVMNPDRWLYQQSCMKWEANWPPKPKTLDEVIEEMPDGV